MSLFEVDNDVTKNIALQMFPSTNYGVEAVVVCFHHLPTYLHSILLWQTVPFHMIGTDTKVSRFMAMMSQTRLNAQCNILLMASESSKSLESSESSESSE